MAQFLESGTTMPNPHFRVNVVSRKAGQSGVASASYRSGEKLHDERVNKTFDYSRKDDVMHSEILAPDNAPDWVNNRSELWNEVEAGEKRKDAQIARHIVAGLARELTPQQHIEQVREYAKTFTSEGMIVDYSIHESTAGDGGKNPHVHIALTMRDITPDGFGNKNREWNKQGLVDKWRDGWEQVTNSYLERSGRNERVSLKTLKEQGIDKEPEIHMGKDAWHLEQQTGVSYLADHNRQIQQNNHERDYINATRSREGTEQQAQIVQFERRKVMERELVNEQELEYERGIGR
jgi:hypothetical protein